MDSNVIEVERALSGLLASFSPVECGPGFDPVIYAGGALIILLTVVNMFLVLRLGSIANERPYIDNVRPDPTPDSQLPPPPPPPEEKVYFLHGFDHNNNAIRETFSESELRGDGVLIGRGSYARVALSDPKISGEHALLRLNGDQLELTDLESMNHTFINGEQLPKGGASAVEIGSKIRFGPQVELDLKVTQS